MLILLADCRCNGVGIPPHIMTVLYFFYRLLGHVNVNGLTQYVVPTSSLRLQRSRTDMKKVVSVQEVRERSVIESEEPQGSQTGSSLKFRIGAALRQRRRQNNGESMIERPPFTIRLAYTGVFFTDVDEPKQDLFCVCIITPLRNFDMLSYITQNFLVQPKTNIPAKYADWNELSFYWKTILQYEANTNCGHTGDPTEHMNEPGGELGVFTLTCMLGLPIRISEVLNGRYQDVRDIKIIGMPNLTFMEDENMDQYVKYMHEYINENVKAHDRLQQDALAYHTASDKDKREMQFQTDSPGGWPLKATDAPGGDPPHLMYIRFGMFPLPLTMWFSLAKSLSCSVNMDSFSLNIGTLPMAVSKKGRDFLTCDPSFESELIMDDCHILTSRVLATPLLISERYYGKGAQPENEFKTVGRMSPWFQAMYVKMQEQRVSGSITPTRAMKIVLKHLSTCYESLTGMLMSGDFRSDYLEQGYDMIRRVNDSQLSKVSVKEYVNRIRTNKVDLRIRHDPYLSMSMAFMMSIQDINRDFLLNSTNLECFLEILMSSLHYLVGCHSSTFVDFFQGVMIMGARGHLDLQDKDGVSMDWRKPNSSGAGTIQDRINKLQEILGKLFGITPQMNKQTFVTNNRWTAVGIENQCCVEVVQNEVVGVPIKALHDQPQLMTEVRDVDFSTIIKWVVKRDPTDSGIAISTVDMNKTNKRDVSLKIQTTRMAVCAWATNVSKHGDEPQTLAVVQHVMAPGASRYRRITESDGKPNSVHCELNDGRAKIPEEGDRQLALVKMIAFSRMFAGIMVALPHRSGMMPFHVSTPTSAFLDWLFMLVKEHVMCLFNVRIVENFGRMKV